LKPPSFIYALSRAEEPEKLAKFAPSSETWVNGDREQEIGFSTATSYAVRGEALKIGLETSYRNVSRPGDRRNAKSIFELGPSFTVKPSPHTRIDLAPLFGTTNDSPHLELFAIFSIDFGTGAEREVEGPATARGRFQ
jgi:hypothetical protein